MSASAPGRRAAVETTVLGAVQSLLEELGSSRAAERTTLNASLEKDLGLGSLERVELLVRLESTLTVRLRETLAQTALTPGDWVRAVLAAEDGARPVGRWPIVQPTREAREPPHHAATFAEVLQEQTDRDPARVQIHLLDRDEGQDISHGQLYASAAQIAAGLVSSGLRPGETVAIMLPTCAEFFSSFLGVMLAGGIAVPVYPPARANQLEEYVKRQSLILQNAEVRFLISFDQVRAVATVLGASLPTLQEAVGARELAIRGRNLPPPETDPAEVFFIQYTSGSTGDPKGVTLTHANVLANVRGIGFAVQAVPSDAVVSWLPLYHDMGLIGSWLFSLYHGFPITILSPLDFLVRPERWLWALSDSRGTLCPAPNFAFELCVRKIRDEAMQGVDLSTWRVAINAGEPVLASTLRRFSERFQPWGFDSRSLLPFYGLAESSVALTYPPLLRGPVVDKVDRLAFEVEGRAIPADGEESSEILEFVSNGQALPRHEIRIVGEQDQELPERVRGQILFRGPSRTHGYYRNSRATEAVLDADGWMDSGDLGYIAGGELYVTGRLKDCIIKAGRNIIPQDVEMAAWEVDGVRKGCVAAFGSSDAESGTEKLVVVAETRVADREGRRRMQTEVTEAVTRKVGLPPDDVVLANPGVVPKTSSGKIQRVATRHLYEQGAVTGRALAAPWVQMARLWLRSAALATASRAAWVGPSVRHAGAAVLRSLLAVGFGLAARLAPTPGAARCIVSPGARMLVALSGVPLRGRVPSGNARIVLVNRAHRLDPLVVAGAIRSPFVFADASGFPQLRAAEAFLLDPLVAGGAGVNLTPAGGTLLDRMRTALEAGHTVVSLADNPVGEPPARTRFRAEGFLAAASTGAPVVPVFLGLNPGGGVEARVSEPLTGAQANGDLAASRAAVRALLTEAATVSVSAPR